MLKLQCSALAAPSHLQVATLNSPSQSSWTLARMDKLVELAKSLPLLRDRVVTAASDRRAHKKNEQEARANTSNRQANAKPVQFFCALFSLQKLKNLQIVHHQGVQKFEIYIITAHINGKLAKSNKLIKQLQRFLKKIQSKSAQQLSQSLRNCLTMSLCCQERPGVARLAAGT